MCAYANSPHTRVNLDVAALEYGFDALNVEIEKVDQRMV